MTADKFMALAIEQAKLAWSEIPVGAVVVKNGEVLARAFNTKEIDNDISCHAEIVALRLAAKVLNNWRLDGCELYVTLEPCPMCAWAILQSRIKSIYFGSYDSKYGGFTVAQLEKISEYKPSIYGGIREKECNNLLEKFFKNVRMK